MTRQETVRRLNECLLEEMPDYRPLAARFPQGKCLLHLVYDLPKADKAAPPHEQLAYYRRLRGLSKDELAVMIGVSAGEIVNYEKQFQEIYDDQAQKLAQALDMDSGLLLDDYTRFVSPGYGQRIKNIRNELGLSQNRFSQLLGVNRSTVSIWEIELHRPSRQNYQNILAIKANQEVSA